MTSRDAVLVAATVAVGLMAGLFFAFSVAVMPGLAKTADRTLVEAMQRINVAIRNGWFLLAFGGSLLLLGAAVALCLGEDGRGPLPWVIAATALYLAVLAVTFGVSIPLNESLDAAGDPARRADIADVRERFEAAWVRWNLVRTLLHGRAGLLGLGARAQRPGRRGSGAAHRAHVKSSSLTRLRSPQRGQCRKTTACVNQPGRASPARSRAAARAGQEGSGSGQYPVDWLLTSLTSQPPSSRAANAISPAARTGPPPAHATCSLRRGASRSVPAGSTTYVKGSSRLAAAAPSSHSRRSSGARTARPAAPGRTTAARRSCGPT